MIKSTGLGVAAFGAIALALAGHAPHAQAAFPERDITFMIPYGPGGGFDTYVRRLAPVMERHLPNRVNVIPRNVAGAGGRKALASLYRTQPDGYMISIMNMPGMLLDKILGEPTNFDIDAFTWVGRIGVSTYVLTASGRAGITRWEDLKGMDLKYAITSWSSGSYVSGRILAEATGLNVTFLPGYKGSADISLSMARGDTEISLFNTASAAQWAEGGDINIVLSMEPESPFENVPSVADIGFPELTMLTVDRYVAAPPGLSPELTAILSRALLDTLNDPEIQKWAEEGNREINPLGSEESAKAVREMGEFYARYSEALAKR